MATESLPWFRFFTDTKDNKKLHRASRELGLSMVEVLGFWSGILCLAGESPVWGELYISKTVPMTADDVLSELQCVDDESRLRFGNQEASGDQPEGLFHWLMRHESLKLVNGVYVVKDWDKMQKPSDCSTRRVQEWRKRQTQQPPPAPAATPKPLRPKAPTGATTKERCAQMIMQITQCAKHFADSEYDKWLVWRDCTEERIESVLTQALKSDKNLAWVRDQLRAQPGTTAATVEPETEHDPIKAMEED